MTLLSRNEKELIFDCCFGLTRTEQAISVTTLLAHNEQAADLRARFQATLEPLENVYPEPCPAELAERTVRLLCAIAQGSHPASCMKTTDFSLHEQEAQLQSPGEFDTYDICGAGIMELSPEGPD